MSEIDKDKAKIATRRIIGPDSMTYEFEATEVPRRRYTFSFRPMGYFVLKRMVVKKTKDERETGSWKVGLALKTSSVRILLDNRHETELYEERLVSLPLLPVESNPEQTFLIVIEPYGDGPRSTFSCQFRGVEEDVTRKARIIQ